MACNERMRLLVDYRDTAHAYARSVHDLVEAIALDLEGNMDVLRGSCRSAWDALEKARMRIARHEADHFCDRVSSVVKER